MNLIFDLLVLVGILCLDILLVVIYACITYLTEWKICDMIDNIKRWIYDS